MKKIKLMLEYCCFPIWIYDENRNLIDNDIPNEMNDEKTSSICIEIQKQYDLLFMDNEKEFKHIGFHDENSKNEFIKKTIKIEEMLREKAGKRFLIENAVNVNDFIVKDGNGARYNTRDGSMS
ncbi:MAG: hypothetical protein GX107_02845 [Clostridiales bacterium]|nr:hypothetical protein [Clostridiales bacterium]